MAKTLAGTYQRTARAASTSKRKAREAHQNLTQLRAIWPLPEDEEMRSELKAFEQELEAVHQQLHKLAHRAADIAEKYIKKHSAAVQNGVSWAIVRS